jgi:hypothetical protein
VNVDCELESSGANCSMCTVNPSALCGWCFGDNKCSIASECSEGWYTDLCPGMSLALHSLTHLSCTEIVSISPNYGIIEGGTVINITGIGFNAGTNSIIFICTL